jgi:hypothetical protein
MGAWAAIAFATLWAAQIDLGGERSPLSAQSRYGLGHLDLKCLHLACAVTRRRFPVGASPTRQTLQAASNRSNYGDNEVAESFE